ncbi:hypothetical protein PoB_002822700 [Plakobranchus ocellatus]|uniref:Uncharacterized protein n=1 Tax=Plakobranchus ocellatus TaxID=259542 RepID=A0AAV4A4E4_9GAST|nr:hypothetical protein PoB_002822700 [Plakobranchus ocellatus]
MLYIGKIDIDACPENLKLSQVGFRTAKVHGGRFVRFYLNNSKRIMVIVVPLGVHADTRVDKFLRFFLQHFNKRQCYKHYSALVKMWRNLDNGYLLCQMPTLKLKKLPNIWVFVKNIGHARHQCRREAPLPISTPFLFLRGYP